MVHWTSFVEGKKRKTWLKCFTKQSGTANLLSFQVHRLQLSLGAAQYNHSVMYWGHWELPSNSKNTVWMTQESFTIYILCYVYQQPTKGRTNSSVWLVQWALWPCPGGGGGGGGGVWVGLMVISWCLLVVEVLVVEVLVVVVSWPTVNRTPIRHSVHFLFLFLSNDKKRRCSSGGLMQL